MPLDIETVIDTSGWNEAFDPDQLAQTCIEACVKAQRNRERSSILKSALRKSSAEACVIFCADKKMRELNRQWRAIDKPTNVLSFPAPHQAGSAPFVALGDIFLGLETVKREALEQGKLFRAHTAHMIVHGFLHLIGYDHEKDAEATEMESEEVAILATLGIENPYEGDWRPESAG